MITVSQLILNLISGSTTAYGDILDWIKEKNAFLLSSCGLLPFPLCREKPTIMELGHKGFSGLIVSGVLKEGQVTVMRLNENIGNYELLVFRGEGIKTEPRQGRFPALNIRLNIDEVTFLSLVRSQHLAIAYGDFVPELNELSKYLKKVSIKIY